MILNYGRKREVTMEKLAEVMSVENIQNRVYVIRGQQVMLDFDLAEIYGYEVKNLNQQVKRNIVRFPEDFMFQLTREEIDFVKSQIVISRENNFFEGQGGGRRRYEIHNIRHPWLQKTVLGIIRKN